jgi:adenosine deaminase
VQLAADRGVTFERVSDQQRRAACGAFDCRASPASAGAAAGVRCTVSTDDPLCFANTIADEYFALANEGGFTRAELASIARAGWEIADVNSETRRRVMAEIDQLAA